MKHASNCNAELFKGPMGECDCGLDLAPIKARARQLRVEGGGYSHDEAARPESLIAEIERLRAVTKPDAINTSTLLARLRDYHDQVLQGFRHISRLEEADLIQAAIDGLRQHGGGKDTE